MYMFLFNSPSPQKKAFILDKFGISVVQYVIFGSFEV